MTKTFEATHSQDTPKSTAVDCLTYNARTGELVVDWRGELWKYSGITTKTYDEVLSGTYKNSPAHASVGRSVSKIKRDFGPGERLGTFGEVKFVKAGTAERTFPAAATKSATPAANVAASSIVSPTYSLTPSSSATNVGSEKPAATYTVDFKDASGERKEWTPEGVNSVDEAIAALNEVAAMLKAKLTVTGVYVDFDGEDE